MLSFLSNENVPGDAVTALRVAGFDVAWIREDSPGMSDPDVLKRSQNEQRVLLTFDKDFGELAFHAGMTASAGINLFRPLMRSPGYLARFVVAVLSQPRNWVGHFCVANDSRIRMIPLPA